MHVLKLTLCIFVVYWCSCAADDSTNATLLDASQPNLGKEFGEGVYKSTADKSAAGIVDTLHLEKFPLLSKAIDEILRILNIGIAYIVGYLAKGTSHVPVDPNATQADQNEQVAKPIGTRIGQEAVNTPVIKQLTPEELKLIVPILNRYIAATIAGFFGTDADIGEAESQYAKEKQKPSEGKTS